MSDLGCPDSEASERIKNEIEKVKAEKDSLGGRIFCRILGCPPGLGEPVFDKLEADLAKAMLSLPAARGFELGGGFALCSKRGSEVKDEWQSEDGQILTSSHNGGGILGGISFGGRIEFRVGFKPVSSIGLPQKTLGRDGTNQILELKGRHDPCVVPRALPIVEAMTCLVPGDHFLRQRALETFWVICLVSALSVG